MSIVKSLVHFTSRRSTRIALSALLTLLLGGLLIATIYFTRFDLAWVAFLGGVLFAAVLAMASQASKAEWLVMRRSKQLDRAREQLNQEAARGRNAAEALRAVEARLRLVSDHLPIPVLYSDRDERCRYHNRACEEWLELPPEKITGQLLRDIFDSRTYPQIAPQVARTLAGETIDYELAWPGRNDAPEVLKARQFPYQPDGSPIIGFYLALTRATEPETADKTGETVGDAFLVSSESGETLYLRSITEELMGNIDPREKLVRALQRDEFLLFAQKILALKAGLPEPDCHEILLRLREEEDNLLPPGGFIPVAERCGMLEEIDRWVVHNLILWCLGRQRDASGWRTPLFCVNLSGVSLQSPEFAKFVRQELQHPEFPARALCFEIGEADAISHHDSARRFISALKPSGCRFTIDAFGSTKVSFSYLKGLPVDFLKIDGTIIQNILRDPAELAKARAINTVSGKIGVRTIAEFVETRETLDKLREIGVDYVQGFGIARPGPLGKVA